MAEFKLDEGFSEASGFMDVPDESGAAAASEITKTAVEEWVMAQDESARRDIAFEILRTLRSSTIASVVSELSLLLHHDPVQRLPAEITSEIFTYLDAPVLLTASLVCKAWRERILEPRLWKRLYGSEGWGLEKSEIQAFEKTISLPSYGHHLAPSPRMRDSGIDVAEPKQKRRAPASWLDDRQRSIQMSPLPMDSTATWNEQHGKVEADTLPERSEPSEPMDIDQVMHDVSSPLKPEYQPARTRSNKRSSRETNLTDSDRMVLSGPSKRSSSSHKKPVDLHLIPGLKPSLTILTPSGSSKLSWLYLYKQRRRLEENWNQGRYVNYQLPQVGYEHEGHRECVYTVQFFGKWLVSGSRDHTMRVWDLDTKRVRGPPLVGHTQSVLCLQFDPTPEQDVVISGSSDTTVKVWQFSTGQLIQTLQAHRESVLNLRFDHRYLVTCSKDKLIKIWNRREMDPLNPHYPKVNHKSNAQIPAYIVDTSAYTPLILEQKIMNRSVRTLAPYTHLLSLEGHSAAVNAIQIEGNSVVSASGDRNIRIWNIRDGQLVHTLMGHHKGIACVQYDTKRIVSGSSDNTIRIFDVVTGAEVACLQGHENLVRTVQAGFGDAPGCEEELKVRAEAAQQKWMSAFKRGEITREDLQTQRRSRYRNFNTGDVRRNVVVGAALPPGGGGSRWSRIVSGSYDEQIIVWKQNSDGEWKPAHRLSHADGSQIATALGTAAQAAQLSGTTDGSSDSRTSSVHTMAASSGPSSAPGNLTGNATATAAPIAPVDPGLQRQGSNPGAHQALHQLQHHAQMMNHALTQQNHQAFTQFLHPPAAQPVPAPLLNLGIHAQVTHNTGPHRVFKLQFDSRKIVCCSQDPRIVVWDFANGDKDIEECCRFFTGP